MCAHVHECLCDTLECMYVCGCTCRHVSAYVCTYTLGGVGTKPSGISDPMHAEPHLPRAVSGACAATLCTPAPAGHIVVIRNGVLLAGSLGASEHLQVRRR